MTFSKEEPMACEEKEIEPKNVKEIEQKNYKGKIL
jgi:hypothetical protein